MTTSTFSSREFNQDTGKAKKATRNGPVFITDRGRPSHVLLSIAQYRELAEQQPSIVDLLVMPGAADIEFDAPTLKGKLFRPADLG